MYSLKVGDIVLIKDTNSSFNQYFKAKVANIELAYWQPPTDKIPFFTDSSIFHKYVGFVNEVCWSKRFRIYLSSGSVIRSQDVFPIEPMF